MKKILFDASIHLGQFSISSEEVRVACKNSQVSISTKPDASVVGLITFNENSWVDHIVWGLDRETQDTFYRFMDTFHSIKDIERIPLSIQDTKLALEYSEKFSLEITDALTCAVGVMQNVHEIHTLSKSIQNAKITKFFSEKHNLKILSPIGQGEMKYSDSSSEKNYLDTLEILRLKKINLIELLHP